MKGPKDSFFLDDMLDIFFYFWHKIKASKKEKKDKGFYSTRMVVIAQDRWWVVLTFSTIMMFQTNILCRISILACDCGSISLIFLNSAIYSVNCTFLPPFASQNNTCNRKNNIKSPMSQCAHKNHFG